MKYLTLIKPAAAVVLALMVTTAAALVVRGQDTRPATQASPVANHTKAGQPCYAVMASFPEELQAIESIMIPKGSAFEATSVNGVDFKSAEIGGRRYLFFLTGMSLVNAAMNTQMALDHFNVRAVFFSGIAGGIDPAYSPGDVVVPARWHYHAESAYFNETSPGKYATADYFKQKYKNFGMIFPDDVTVKRDGMENWKQVESFPADEALLAAGRRAAESLPAMKTGDHVCKVTFGGDGVSGTVFCDNAAYRKWVFEVWKAECLDMESTAISHVCWQNKTPCLIVRGLSDLAGGQAGKNQEEQYTNAAADHAARVLAKVLMGLDAVMNSSRQ